MYAHRQRRGGKAGMARIAQCNVGGENVAAVHEVIQEGYCAGGNPGELRAHDSREGQRLANGGGIGAAGQSYNRTAGSLINSLREHSRVTAYKARIAAVRNPNGVRA